MSITYEIREAADIELAIQFRLHTAEKMPEAPSKASIEQAHQIYAEAYRNGSIVHYFAFNQQGEAIASAGALLKTDFPYLFSKPGQYGWIIDVYTKPPYRGNGLARQLIERSNNWLRQKGIYESKLIAYGKKPQKIYEQLGYRPTWEMSLNLNPDVPTLNEQIDQLAQKQ